MMSSRQSERRRKMPRKVTTLSSSRRKGAAAKSEVPDIADVLASLKKILIEDGLLPQTKH